MKMPKPLKASLRLFPTGVMLLTSLILLSYVSYSWIKRDWSSGIDQSGITIATGNTLAFVFNESASGSNVKDLKSLLGVEDFRLKSVSNATGKGGDFYSLTPDARGDAYTTLNHLTWEDLPSISDQNDITKVNTELGVMFGYVDVMFAVQPPPNMEPNETLYVYIDPASKIKNTGDVDVISAIRVSITLPPVNDPGTLEGRTYMFGSEAKIHYGISTKDNYLMNGQFRFTEVDGVLVPLHRVTVNGVEKEITELYSGKEGKLFTFDEFDGSTVDKTLCSLKPGQVQYINVRIWAEGEDESCTNEIAGESFDLLLKFSAIKVSDTSPSSAP